MSLDSQYTFTTLRAKRAMLIFKKKKKIKKIGKFEKLEFQREWMLTFILWYIFGDFQTLWLHIGFIWDCHSVILEIPKISKDATVFWIQCWPWYKPTKWIRMVLKRDLKTRKSTLHIFFSSHERSWLPKKEPSYSFNLYYKPWIKARKKMKELIKENMKPD